QEFSKPDRTLDVTPGHWRSDADFPATGAKEVVFYLQEGGALASRLAAKPHAAFDEFDYHPAMGTTNGFWSAGGMTFYLADDQRADEAYSLTFTSAPLREDVH